MSESALDIAAARAADPYDAFPGYGLTIELIDEALALRAELERVRGERDALAHWRQKFHELAAENTRLESERDQYIERCEDLQTVQLRMVEELARVEGEARVARVERDAARAAAARWKRSAKRRHRYMTYWELRDHENMTAVDDAFSKMEAEQERRKDAYFAGKAGEDW